MEVKYQMADMNTVKEITTKLESGVKDLFESDKYKEYLKTMSRFHRYSARNIMLIYMQRPDATHVAGKTTWIQKFKRQKIAGEKGIKILAPAPLIIKKEKEVIDPKTNKPIIDENGEPLHEEIEIKTARFKIVEVYDVSQTFGEPLPNLVETLTGSVERYELFIDALRETSPLPIKFIDMPDDTDGSCKFGEKISIRNGMSEVQTICAIIHEITHEKLHNIEALRPADADAKLKDRRTEEVEAESVSYAVCQYYGIETGANSFGYLAEWSKSRELKELSKSLDTIRKTATDLIEKIDEELNVLAKERGINLEINDAVEIQKIKTNESTEISNEAKSDQIYNTFSPVVVDLAVQYAASSATLLYTDENEIRRASDQITDRVLDDLLLKSADFFPLYEQYTGNGDFKERMKELIYEKITLERDSPENKKILGSEAQHNKSEFQKTPDPSVSILQMIEYGYSSDNMLPLSSERAIELYKSGDNVYLLYPDSTETLAFDLEEIQSHQGFFGIERTDWETIHDFRETLAYTENSEGSREADLIYSNESKFGIYQIPLDSDQARDYMFENMERLEFRGFTVDRNNYELVYTAPLTTQDPMVSCNIIYSTFQGENPIRPNDYNARSVSVSDVIVLQKNGEVSAYFVDSYGYKEIPGFTGNEMHTNTHKAVDELKAEVDEGKSISLMDLSKAVHGEQYKPAPKTKPSLLNSLERNKQRVVQSEHKEYNNKASITEVTK